MKKINVTMKILLSFFIVFIISTGMNAQEELLALNSKVKREKKIVKTTKIKCNRKNDDMSKCLTCHSKNGWKDMKYVHAPIAMNECRPCHVKAENVKNENMQTVLNKIPCLFCHQTAEIKKVHPDELEEDNPECSGCHDPHASDEEYFLR